MTFHCIVDNVARIELLQGRVGISGVERSHPEDVIDQLKKFFGVAVDRLENLLLLVSQSPNDLIQQKIDESYHHAERSSELVRNVREKIRFDLPKPSFCIPPFQPASNQGKNVIDVEGLGNVVEGAEPQAFDSSVQRAITCDDKRFN